VSGEIQTPADTRSRRLLVAVLAALLVIAAVASFLVLNRLLNTQQAATSGAAIVDSEYYFDGGTPVDPPRVLSDFTLTSHTGQPISLSDLRGRALLIYFGYTFCPDVCPITLGDFRRVRDGLGDDAGKVAFVMISVDGERDTPERLNSYLGAFDPDFIGMTGDEGELQRISTDYGLFFERQPGDERYLVDHTASIFMVDPEGRLTMIYTFGTEPDVIIEGVRGLIG
jgi:protein SCO1/2